MRKIAIALVLMITTFLIGCDFLSGTDPVVTMPGVTTTTGVASFDTNTFIEGVPNTDNVSFDTLFDDSIYKKFTIYFSEANFMKLIYDMENYYDEWGNYRDNTIQEVDVLYEDGLGNVYEINEVGFRTKGNIFSRVLPAIVEGGEIQYFQQTSFQLEFNETFDYVDNSTEYDYLKSRDAFDMEQLNFKHIRSTDYAVVTESVSYDMFREAGVVTSNTSYTLIYFDIEGLVVPYGLFLIQEPMDDEFVKRYWDKNDDSSIGDLYKCAWQTMGPATLKNNYANDALGVSDYNEGYRKTYALKTNKDLANFDSFEDFSNLASNTSVFNYYNSIGTSLMIDNFAKASALHFLIGSPDDYRSNANNYYMYFNEGKSYYIPFDFDNALGNGWNPYGNFGVDLDIDTVQPSNGLTASNMVLIYNLLQEDSFLTAYYNYLDLYTQTNGIFNYDDIFSEYNLIYNLYYNEIIAEEHLGINYFDISSRWESMSVEDYMNAKIQSVRAQLTELGVI
ncbi:MAG: CotH kinase family protein [Tenericutes bacterium]|nr:CotH kinase family protein [Mycoplasmatota bacterium]